MPGEYHSSPNAGRRGGYHGSQGSGTPGEYHGTQRGNPGALHPGGRNSMQHNQPQALVHPRRFQGTNFPTPNRWHGSLHNFDRHHWRGGRWRHEHHNGQWGWWWIIGPSWYFYEEPVYPYPDMYTPPGEEPGWWYWCDYYQEYYPYVTFCPSGWQLVPMSD